MKYLVILFTFLFLVGCSKFYGVKYDVTSTVSRVSVSYINETGEINNESDVPVPWSYSFRGRTGNDVSVYAYIPKDTFGTITVTIYKDGKVFRTATSSGTWKTSASSSGRL